MGNLITKYTLGLRAFIFDKSELNDIANHLGKNLIYYNEHTQFPDTRSTFPAFYVKLTEYEIIQYLKWRGCDCHVFFHPLTLEFFDASNLTILLRTLYEVHPNLITLMDDKADI